jgi:predicted nucleic acid-binding protein
VNDIVVSDAGPLIALGTSGLLPQLETLFRFIYIPPAVEREVLCDLSRPGVPEIKEALLTGLIKRKKTNDKQALKALTKLLNPGQAEALALAGELEVNIIIDEKRGVVFLKAEVFRPEAPVRFS